jgi:predicted DNA-binding protein YlxM (UPF0122 family)
MSETQISKRKLSELTQASDFSVQELANRPSEFKSKNKKGGPYSKKDRDSRIDEVCRLHFEYGYSAKKISELMKINRNTINSDIKQLYLTLESNWEKTTSVSLLQNHIESVLAQKRRLREALDNTEKFSEKLAIEKMILQVESKINQFQLRRGRRGIVCKTL